MSAFHAQHPWLYYGFLAAGVCLGVVAVCICLLWAWDRWAEPYEDEEKYFREHPGAGWKRARCPVCGQEYLGWWRGPGAPRHEGCGGG